LCWYITVIRQKLLFGSCLYKSKSLSKSLKPKSTCHEKPEKHDNRAAVEQWRAKVVLNTIRSQLKMFESNLWRVLPFAKANPVNPIKSRKPVSGRPMKLSIDQEGGMAKY
jgi:hypothetical protein